MKQKFPLTHSSRGTYFTCPRKYLLSYHLGIRKVRDPDYLRLGGNWAYAHYLFRDKDFKTAINWIDATYGVYPKWATSQDDRNGWKGEREILLRLLNAYQWRWEKQAIVFVQAEAAFNLPIYNPNGQSTSTRHSMAGVRDGIVRSTTTGELCLFEQKLVAEDISPAATVWKVFQVDDQTTGYLDASRRMGQDVKSVIFDLTRKPGIRPKAPVKKDVSDWPMYFGERQPGLEPPERESVAMYGARLAMDIYNRPDWYFNRRVITRSADEIGEYRYDLWDKHRSIMRSETDNIWPKNSRSCELRGTCEYLTDFCSQNIKPQVGDELPEGFHFVDDVHPEVTRHTLVEDVSNANETTPATATACA